MLAALLRRIALIITTAGGVVTLVFLLIHLVPGDPIDAMLGESASVADRQQLRSQLGLDEPLLRQYIHYVSGVARGDLGVSLLSGQTVASAIGERYLATVELAIGALVLALALALPLGLLGAARPGSAIDVIAQLLAVASISTPSFWLGPLLILLFSIWLEWMPVSGRGDLSHLLLPALTLGLGMSALLSRMLRASLLERLGEDYIRTARAKGVGEASIFLKHALRNAALPVISVLGLQAGALLGGAIITETVFAWPGIGRLLLQSIQARDYPLVQGCILVIALSYVAINSLTDVLYLAVDPRARRSR